MSTVVKTNLQGYVKDVETGVVTNVNREALQEHKLKVAKSKEIKKLTSKVEELESRIKALESLQPWIPSSGSILLSEMVH